MNKIRLTPYYYSDFLCNTWLFNVIGNIYILNFLKHYNLILKWPKMKDQRQKNIFILRTTFWRCLVPILKCV